MANGERSIDGKVVFLYFIDDLPNNVPSKVGLFSGDIVFHKSIYTITDSVSLQKDLLKLENEGKPGSSNLM